MLLVMSRSKKRLRWGTAAQRNSPKTTPILNRVGVLCPVTSPITLYEVVREVIVTRKDLGPTPVGEHDQLTLGWAHSTFPSYSTYILAESDLYLTLPETPTEHQMEVFEVKAGADRILVFSPSGVLPCLGAHPAITVEAHKTVFMGFRYSSHASAWFLLSTALQA